jgi:HEPN domain-containing protein
MNSREDVEYRLNLAKGFLKEAEEDFQLKRWRSCVNSAQLSVENSGKAILMIFGVSPKTHEPAKFLGKLVHDMEIPNESRDKIKEILPDFLTLGAEEHFMTDYGDESSYKLPWQIFDEGAAKLALNAAKGCKEAAEDIIKSIRQWRSKKNK